MRRAGSRTARPLVVALAGVLAAGGLAAPGAAQEVELRGSAEPAIDQRLAELLALPPIVFHADTLIAERDTLRRSVLVLDATIILEGTILGDLVLVDAGTFVRPSAVVEGDIVNVAGGLYLSELASIGGSVVDHPAAPYRVIREPGVLVIEASGTPSRLQLDDFAGFHPPTYDRVNGLTAVWGATYRLPSVGQVQPYIHGQAGWRTELGEPVYGAELGVRWRATSLGVGYERLAETNEEWIRDDLMNSLNYVWSGKDYRDYYEAKRAWAGVSHLFGDPDLAFDAMATARLQVEDGSTLGGDDPWHLWGDSVRENRVIDDGRITSAVAEVAVGWRGLQTAAEGVVSYEKAFAGLDGEPTFDLVRAVGEVAVQAFADQTIEVELYAQMPIGDQVLPRQRWSFVGGSGTLQTVDFAEFYGDRVVFVETKYVIPMPRYLALPVLGAPEVELVHGTGMAWTADDARSFHQEVGTRIQFFALYLRYMFEPEDPDNADLDIGVSWPFGSAYPWQR